MSAPDYYKIIPKEYLQNDTSYPNYEKTKVIVPCRAIFYGPPGSGKNNSLLYWLFQLECFSEFYICAKNFNQPLWRYFIDKTQDVERKVKQPILFLCSQPDEMPKLDTIVNDGKRRAFIWDDCLTCNKKEYECITTPYVNGRNLGISCFFLSQAWTPIHRIIRLSCDYIVIKKLRSTGDLKRIIREASLDIKPEQLNNLYKEATKDTSSFLLIDKVTNDPDLMFRRNFTPCSLPVMSHEEEAKPKRRRVKKLDE